MNTSQPAYRLASLSHTLRATPRKLRRLCAASIARVSASVAPLTMSYLGANSEPDPQTWGSSSRKSHAHVVSKIRRSPRPTATFSRRITTPCRLSATATHT